MVVAVDTRGTKEYQDFIYKVFTRIAANHPGHTFIFLSEPEAELNFTDTGNITSVVLKKPVLSLLGNFTITSILKKYNADRLVTQRPSGTNVPQCLIFPFKPRRNQLKKAAVIITDSHTSIKQLHDTFKTATNKIHVVYKGVDEEYKPVSPEQKEILKESLAEGNEYFLADVSSKDNIVNVLKAFSVFKKMLKSNMYLVIRPESAADHSSLLNAYRFKSEVRLLDIIGPQQMPAIVASAYAFISVNEYSAILQSMQCGIPVMADNNEVNVEIAGDAAIYFDVNEHTAIADKMMQLYKDENLRSRLIEKGKEQVKKYLWNDSDGILWKSIEKACG